MQVGELERLVVAQKEDLVLGRETVDPGGTPPGTNPIRLGSSSILTFTPLGTSSPGTLYVRGRRGIQYAIRILGETGKTRVLKFDPRTRRWKPA